MSKNIRLQHEIKRFNLD